MRPYDTVTKFTKTEDLTDWFRLIVQKYERETREQLRQEQLRREQHAHETRR